MASNRWLVLALLAGSVLSVALLASIPIYTDGVLQRLLTRDLERYQERTGRYPGTTAATYNFYRLVERPAAKAPFHDSLEHEILTNLVPNLGVPVAAAMKRITLDYLYDIRPQPEERRVETVKKFSRVEALQELEPHITLLHGRMHRPQPVDGVYEAIVTGEAMRQLELILDRTYLLHDLLAEEPRLQVKVVGVFTKKDPSDLFWFQRFTTFSESFLIDYETFLRDFLYQPARNLTNGAWYFALDYHQITLDNVPNLLRRYDEYLRAAAERRVELDFGIAKLLEEYNRRAAILKITLSFLHVPIVLVLAFFMYMVSQLIVEGDLAEIAVLESRGAAGGQLFTVYLIQSPAARRRRAGPGTAPGPGDRALPGGRQRLPGVRQAALGCAPASTCAPTGSPSPGRRSSCWPPCCPPPAPRAPPSSSCAGAAPAPGATPSGAATIWTWRSSPSPSTAWCSSGSAVRSCCSPPPPAPTCRWTRCCSSPRWCSSWAAAC